MPDQRVVARDGLPVPGGTTQQCLSLIIWRALGPLKGRAQSVLDWAGMTGRGAGPCSVVAARHGVGIHAIYYRVGKVAEVGRRTPLPDHVAQQATAPSGPGEDHRARSRQARLLGLPAPQALQRPHLPPDHHAIRESAIRMLAALGPLTGQMITDGLARSRRPRRHGPLTTQIVEQVLSTCDAIQSGADDRWVLTADIEPAWRDARLVAAAAASGRVDFSWTEIVHLLEQAGYSPTTARGPVRYGHPLIRRAGHRWMVLSVSTTTG